MGNKEAIAAASVSPAPGEKAETVCPEVQIRVLTCAFYRDFHWYPRNHAAPYWRFYWNESAGATVTLQKRDYPLVPDLFMLIPPNTPFVPRNSRPMQHFFVHFLVSPPYDRVNACILSGPASAAALSTVQDIIHVLNTGQVLPAPLTVRLLGLLYSALAWVPGAHLPSHDLDARIARIQAHMDEHLAEPLRNADLATLAGMSTTAFIRFFGAQTGQSPRQYLTNRRLDKACLRLHFSDATVEAIAADCGFCDRHYFTRVFARARGVGPVEFRRQVRPAAVRG